MWNEKSSATHIEQVIVYVYWLLSRFQNNDKKKQPNRIG